MSATNQFEDDLLDLIFTNVDAPNVGDAGGLQNSAAAGNAFISLHTGNTLADTTTDSTTAEAAYTGYGRETVARSTSGFTVASGNVDNDAAITFGECTAGSETETDVGITFLTGNYLQLWASLTADLAVSAGIIPEFAAGELNFALD